MRRGRVLVLRLGVWGLGVDAKSRTRPAESRRETQNCRHFWTRVWSSRLKSGNSHRGRGGSWARNAELLSRLACVWSSRLKSANSHRGRRGRGRVMHPVWSSRLKSVNSHRHKGVMVAKRRTVVTFGRVERGERRGEERREMSIEKRGEEKRERGGERIEERTSSPN